MMTKIEEKTLDNAILNAVKRIIDKYDTDAKCLVLNDLCKDIADGPQEFHEANTADGWADVLLAADSLLIVPSIKGDDTVQGLCGALARVSAEGHGDLFIRTRTPEGDERRLVGNLRLGTDEYGTNALVDIK